MRMNPLKFYLSKVDEDPQGFIKEMYNIMAIMGVSLEKKEEFLTY